MSRTLNLIDLLLNSGRHLAAVGRTAEAIDTLTRLSEFRKLPSQTVEEIQFLLAELSMQREDFAKARRHLTAALTFRPLKAEYHYLMAVAIEADDEADRKRAGTYYERAVELESDNADYWVDFGSHLLRVGKTKAGMKAIRKAYALGINDVDIVGQVAEALRGEERYEEASTKLRGALFRNHGDARFRTLWQEHQFQMVRYQQEMESPAQRQRKQRPVILPFTPATQTGKYVALGGRTIRFDAAEPLSEPKAAIKLPFRQPPPKG